MNSRRRMTLAGVVAGTSVAGLGLAACLPSLEQVSPDDSTPWPGAEPHPSFSGDYSTLDIYNQGVNWTPCGDLDCATIQVPLDWSDPAGPTVSLAINRSPARSDEDRIGSLLINPGGPGASGLGMTEYVAAIAGDRVVDAYDIVGFDPRGVGESSPINCGTDAELDAYFLSDDVIETEEELVAARQRTADFAQRCRELTGPLIENVDTASAARDMDVIRAAVGDEVLHYLGFSYGTQLGAVYATLYPENVGRMVLDGAVDFLLPAEDISLGQAGGFEAALDAYVADCVANAGCPLGRDVGAAKRKINDMFTEARDVGFPTGNEDVNGTLLIYGVVVTLYDDQTWTYLTAALTELDERGTARMFLDLANIYLERSTVGGWQSNGQEAFVAIGCLDTPPLSPLTIAEFREYQDLAEEASPTFGWWFGAGAGCEGWPWSAREQITDLSNAASADPLIVIGTTGDPATPLAWAESLADRFPSASLLVFDGEGHTAYGRSNSCITDAVDDYLVDGTVPTSGTTC